MTGVVAKPPLKRDGQYEVRQSGDHHHYIHPTKAELVTVPERATLAVPLVKSILRQARLINEEFTRLIHRGGEK